MEEKKKKQHTYKCQLSNNREHDMKMSGPLKKCMLEYHTMQYNEELNTNNEIVLI